MYVSIINNTINSNDAFQITANTPKKALRISLRPGEAAIHRRINEYEDDQPDAELVLTCSR